MDLVAFLASPRSVALNGAPVEVTGQEELSRRLNGSPFTERDVSPGTSYAKAGLARDGVAETIRSDMARLFPGVRVSDATPGDAAVAFAYLKASVPFRLPYHEAKDAWVERFERAYVEAILAQSGGNVSKAARDAGVDRRHLQRLMARFGLKASD